MENKNLFEVGMRVWDFCHGWGRVIEIVATTKYNKPVRVKFDETDICIGFTNEGRQYAKATRTLFFEEIPIPKSALVKPRKTAEQMLEECEEVEFIKEGDNYSLFYNTCTREVNLSTSYICKQYNVKYISKEDAERIVKECRENNV